jgi:chromosome segregation ATPase
MSEDTKDVTVQLATAVADAGYKAEQITKLEGTVKDLRESVDSATKRAESAEMKLRENQAEITTARLSVDRRTSDVKEAEDQIESLQSTVKDLRTQLAQKTNETKASRVVSLCKAAIKDGVPPAKIAIFGDYEKDPVKLVDANFGGSIESFELVLKSLPRDASFKRVDSAGKSVEEDSAVDPNIAAELRRRGLNPKYASLSNSDQLAEVKASEKK